MATVSIWKRVYRDELMMKPSPYFIYCVRLVTHPISNVRKQLREFFSNLMRRDANVFFGGSIHAGPLPSLVEHSPMQLSNIRFIKGVAQAKTARVQSPTYCDKNIFSLPFVKLLLIRKIWKKVALFFGSDRSDAV